VGIDRPCLSTAQPLIAQGFQTANDRVMGRLLNEPDRR
jgi:hypothetical protein